MQAVVDGNLFSKKIGGGRVLPCRPTSCGKNTLSPASLCLPLPQLHHIRSFVPMASSLLPRLAMRQSVRLVAQRRAASTTSEAANAASKGATAAKETAESTVSKAQQGLSKVTSSAGPALSKAAASAQNAVSNVGGRTGAAINWVQGRIRHLISRSHGH